MMVLLTAVILLSTTYGYAQEEDVKTLQQHARQYMQSGDYSNATLVLTRALEKEPGNMELKNDLLFNYYLGRDFGKAMELGKQLTEKQDPDIRSFQLLGMTYKAIEEIKECEKLYKAGIKLFPNSGVLFNDYGELQWNRKKLEDAIDLWEKGISADPNYSGNYYNAARYYYVSTDKIWALIYGEIFVNLESYSRRTPEIKQLLLDAYKKYFTNMNGLKAPDKGNGFEVEFSNLLNKHASAVNAGVNTASLTMLRSKFILDWYQKDSARYPFRLFEYQRQLLREGFFEAYNQWIFGAAQDLPAFQEWTQQNHASYDSFIRFQKGRVFKMPGGQQYRFN